MEFLTKEFIYSKSSQEITSLLYEALMDRVREAIDAIEKRTLLKQIQSFKRQMIFYND